MAVNGLDLFQKHFAPFEEAFVLIGGAACDLWFTDQGLPFRATNDLDIVLLVEALTPEFISHLQQFIQDAGYEKRYRSNNGTPVLYRFAMPMNKAYPVMIELFSQSSTDNIIPDPKQHIIPIRIDAAQSLSAILLNEAYYNFLLQHRYSTGGIRIADGVALIPFKARAWLDLTERRKQGETIRGDDIKKHRNDVFRLASTLPGNPRNPLPSELAIDLERFLNQFPNDAPDWTAIQQAIRPTTGGTIPPATLLSAIRTFYQLSDRLPIRQP